MRYLLVLLTIFLMVAWSTGCAQTGACPAGQALVDGACKAPPPPCPESITKPIPVGCVLNPAVALSEVAYFTWVLTVKPTRIISGEPFGASFEGLARFDTALLNLAQTLLAGFRRVAIVDLKATVHVRKGAEADGGDVVLEFSPIERTCTYDEDGHKGPYAGPEFPPCTNDDDCTGLGGAPNSLNRCLSFVEVPTSDDCTETGVCAELGQTGLSDSPCELNGFCVNGPVEISLEANDGSYMADSSGSVLFGWADQGVDLLDVGPNRGAYDPMEMRRDFEEGIVRTGFNAVFDGDLLTLPLAFECLMGVNSRGPDGVPTIDPLLSPSPDGILISCPIQKPE